MIFKFNNCLVHKIDVYETKNSQRFVLHKKKQNENWTNNENKMRV